MPISKILLGSILIASDEPKKSDAIVCLTGDYLNRVQKSAELYKAGLAPRIVISGGLNKPSQGSFHCLELRKAFLKLKIPKNKIILDEKSQNTRDQAVNVIRLAKRNKWDSLILVASHFHQVRAYLTFLKAMMEAKVFLRIYNAPAKNIKWFEKYNKSTRFDELSVEFQKIHTYKKHVASMTELIHYFSKRESK